MIGVRAEGVAKEPTRADDMSAWGDPDRVYYARNMDGVPGLTDWWIALQAAVAIEVTKTRVRRVPAVSAEGGISHDTMLRVLAEYVAEVASELVDADASEVMMEGCEVTLRLLTNCLEAGIDGSDLARRASEGLEIDHERPIAPQMGEHLAWRRLLTFERAGVLERGKDARLRVVPMLRGVVQYAINTASARYNLAVS